jgi:hypothetical protein
MKLRTIIAVIILACCNCAIGNAGTFDAKYFQLNLPDSIEPINLPADMQGNDSGSFTYAFKEANKENDKSILIVVTGEKNKNIKITGKEYALGEMTDALRNSTMNAGCKGQTSDIVRTRIGSSDALYFEKANSDCIVLLEKYWSVINGETFIIFQVAKPVAADDKVFVQSVEAIKNAILK